jgi:hypothetical protein
MSQPRTSPPDPQRPLQTATGPARLAERPSFLFPVAKGAGFLVLGFVGAWLARFAPDWGPAAAPGGGTGTKAAAAPEKKPRTVEETTAAGTLRVELARAKVKQGELVASAKAASEAAEQAFVTMTEFEARMSELLRDTQGRAIGANPELLDQFVALKETDRPGPEEVKSIRSALARVAQPLEASLGDPDDATLPPETLASEIGGLRDRANEARGAYEDARDGLLAITSRVEGKGDPGGPTLEEAMARHKDAEARAESERIAAERAKARAEAAAELAAQEAEHERALAAKRLEEKKAEQEAALARQEQDRKRKLAEDPAIQAQFQPLLAKGRWLFDQGQFSRISAPASYSILLKMGYLRSYETFARAMAGWTNFPRSYSPGDGYYTEFSDRPRHPMPTTEAEWVEMKALHERFKELAPVWVEMGLLAK